MSTLRSDHQPMEYALCSCVLAVRLGEALGLGESDLRGAYYQALLRYIGCNAETYLMVAVVGDELALRTDLAALYNGSTSEVLGLMTRSIRQAHEGVLSNIGFLERDLPPVGAGVELARVGFLGKGKGQ